MSEVNECGAKRFDRELDQARAAAPTVIVVGASVRSAVSSLRDSNRRCVGIDLFGDQDTVENVARMHVVKDADELLAVLASYQDSPVIIAGQWPGMVAQLRNMDQRRLPLVNHDAWQKAVSLRMLAALARQCDVQVPTTITEQSVSESINRNGRWLMKQADSSGGLGVQFAAPSRMFQAQDSAKPSGSKKTNARVQLSKLDADSKCSVFQQQWIPGRRWGASFIASRNQVAPLGLFRSSVHRRDEKPFTYGGSTGPYFNLSIDQVANGRKEEVYFADGKVDSDSKDNLMMKMLDVARALVSRTGILGVFNIDFLVDASSTIWLLEVNPRWTASCELSERAFSGRACSDGKQAHVSLMKLVIGMIDKNDSQRELPNWILQPPVCKNVWTKRIIYARSDVAFSLKRLKQRCAWINHPSGVVEICDIPCDAATIKKGDPICTIIMQLGTVSPKQRAWEIRHLTQTLLASLDQAPTTSAAL